MTPRSLLLALPLAVLAGAPARATESRATATGATAMTLLEQARASMRPERGYQRLRMVIASPSGQERTRELEVFTRRDADATRVRLNLLGPAEVAGTSLILIDRVEGEDQQLLYLPALKKISVLVGLARRASFVGSDLNHEDLDLSYVEGGSACVLSEDTAGWEVELVPGADAPWSRMVVRVDRQGMLASRIDFYETSGVLARQVKVTERLDSGGLVLARTTVVSNLKRGSSTRIEVVDSRVDLSEDEVPLSLFSATSFPGNTP